MHWRFETECSSTTCINKSVNKGVDVAISCKNLVNFGAVIPEITFLISVPLCGYSAKIGLRSPFVKLAFPDSLDD